MDPPQPKRSLSITYVRMHTTDQWPMGTGGQCLILVQIPVYHCKKCESYEYDFEYELIIEL